MGEARRRQLARQASFAEGRKWRVEDDCPACGSKRVARLPVESDARNGRVEEMAGCLSCRAIWEPYPLEGVEEDAVCSKPCDNCAFRPGSLEQQDKARWRELLADLDPDPETGMFRGQFFCHKRVPIDVSAAPGTFLFPRKPDGTYDTAKMRTCSGFLAMVWARNEKQRVHGGIES